MNAPRDVALAPPSAGHRARKWLSALNEAIGIASRQLFQSQLLLRASSEQEIRDQLPELCAFATSIRQSPVKRHGAIRAAFADQTAQWLSRSAMESGASGFFCHLMLKRAEEHGRSIRLVLLVLLDAVMLPCRERQVKPSSACTWRGDKPKYYKMSCSAVWETLLPFLVKAARQYPTELTQVLVEYSMESSHRRGSLVNCRFAQVAGFWRVLGAVNESSNSGVRNDQAGGLLSFSVLNVVLPLTQAEEQAPTDEDPFPRFYDLLFDKFFQDLQEFQFKTGPSSNFLCNSLSQAIASRMPAGSSVDKRRLAAFASASCLFVKGLGTSIANDVFRFLSHSSPSDPVCLWAVSIVSHVTSIDTKSVLVALQHLLDQYQSQHQDSDARRQYLLWIVYIIVCRQHEFPLQSPQFVSFQKRLISDVSLVDLQLMPLHWMETVWATCFSMTANEVSAFTEEARAARLLGVDQPDACIPLPWEASIKQLAFRHFDQYPTLLKTLGDQFLHSLQRVFPTPSQRTQSLIDDITAVNQSRKRRRLRRDVVTLSDELEASRQQTLFLPEVMERICGFMSAKRLTRLSLVCKAFASVAKSERLWQPLYRALVLPLKVKCRHGIEYHHAWRAMYQAKHKAIKKLKTRRRLATKKAERRTLDEVAFHWHEDDSELRMSVTVTSTLQLCRECGCDQVLGSNEIAKIHRELHQKHRCPHRSCCEALTSAAALRLHLKTSHPSELQSKPKAKRDELAAEETEKPVHLCPFDGCTRSYKSVKWLESHIHREHPPTDHADEGIESLPAPVEAANNSLV